MGRSAHRDPLTAGLLALVPGAGHVYCGRHLRGLTFFMGTLTGLVLYVAPGLIIWAASVPDAVACARRRNRAAPPLEHTALETITDGPDPAVPRPPSPLPRPSDPEPPRTDPSPGSPR